VDLLQEGLGRASHSTVSEKRRPDPTNPVYAFHLGLAHAKAGDSLQAREALQQALTLARDFKGADEAKQLLVSLER
jgi:Flp pilus assembly protein TadD